MLVFVCLLRVREVRFRRCGACFCFGCLCVLLSPLLFASCARGTSRGSPILRILACIFFSYKAALLLRLRCVDLTVMWRICLGLFVGGAAQTFPVGVAPLLSKLRAEFGGVDGANVAATSELASRAAAELGNKVAHAKEAAAMEESAARIAARDVLHFKYVGACKRDLGGCPSGWEANSSGLCLPPDNYDGPCASVDVSGLSATQKDEFALSCQAAWPCSICITDFSSCPSGWSTVGRLCVAPASYDGACSPVVDFTGALPGDKASWSASCGARWPCTRGE